MAKITKSSLFSLLEEPRELYSEYIESLNKTKKLVYISSSFNNNTRSKFIVYLDDEVYKECEYIDNILFSYNYLEELYGKTLEERLVVCRELEKKKEL